MSQPSVFCLSPDQLSRLISIYKEKKVKAGKFGIFHLDPLDRSISPSICGNAPNGNCYSQLMIRTQQQLVKLGHIWGGGVGNTPAMEALHCDAKCSAEEAFQLHPFRKQIKSPQCICFTRLPAIMGQRRVRGHLRTHLSVFEDGKQGTIRLPPAPSPKSA